MSKEVAQRLTPVSLKNVAIHDAFLGTYQQLIRDVVVPYQWDMLNDNDPNAEPTHTIRNFRIAAGEEEGEFHGMSFQDSDVGKWLETVGYVLSVERDEQLEQIADDVIDLIGRAQHDDGYINTFFTVKHPGKRWTNLRDCHELYSAGHLMEAAVAYYKATGKTKLLDIMSRFADYMLTVFGTEPGQIRGYDAHPEIELALVKLYRVTRQQKYLQLSKFFVDERGQQPYFYEIEAQNNPDNRPPYFNPDYSQAHKPVREQETADGHSVRAMYLYSGMADLVMEYGDRGLLEACLKLWDNVTKRRMYITGGIGSSSYGEAFTTDYDLPNDRSYTETCAAIGLVFWAQRMLQLEPSTEYADVMERALYNGVLSGMSLDGKKYFYVNPLEVWPEACEKRHDLRHVKTTRQPWFGCACCPPNVARLLASLGEYMYSKSDQAVYVHLYASSRAMFELNGQQVELTQHTNYPWQEIVNINVNLEKTDSFTIALRLPAWCDDPQLFVNGEPIQDVKIDRGYAMLHREWQQGDTITLRLPMTVKKIAAHPQVRENAGKVALQRGPIVYCLEETDNSPNLHNIVLPKESEFSVTFKDHLLPGTPVISGEGLRSNEAVWKDSLYQPVDKSQDSLIPVTVQAIPYFLWNNRGEGEMIVWIQSR